MQDYSSLGLQIQDDHPLYNHTSPEGKRAIMGCSEEEEGRKKLAQCHCHHLPFAHTRLEHQWSQDKLFRMKWRQGRLLRKPGKQKQCHSQ